MQVELSRDERFEIANALNTEAQRFEHLIDEARVCRRDWIGSIPVWEEHVAELRALTAKVLGRQAKAAA